MVFLILLVAFIIIDYKYDLYLDINREQIVLWYNSEYKRKYYIIWDGNRR